MPFVKLVTNSSIESKEESLKRSIGELISILPGKSESWLMVELEGNKTMYFKGSADRCAMIDVNLYGLSVPQSSLDKFTEKVTDLVSSNLGINPSRIYVSYFLTDKWGYSGSNF